MSPPRTLCYRFCGILLLWLFLVVTAAGQTGPGTDTLETARQMVQNQRIRHAFRLMRTYQAAHPEEFNTAWLYGNIAWLNHRVALSKQQYETALRLRPDNYCALLDYARVLAGSGEEDQATAILDRYLAWDPGNGKVLLLKAKLAFWNLDFKQADSLLRKIASDEFSATAGALQEEILQARSPWVGIGTEGFADNQPLAGVNPLLEAGMFLGRAASPWVKLIAPILFPGTASNYGLWLRIGNRSVFPKAGVTLDFSSGVIVRSGPAGTSWTASADVTKTFLHHLPVALTLSRNPYFSTNAGADTAVFEERIGITAGWNDNQSVFGEAACFLYYYPVDGNPVLSAGGWAFAPPLKIRWAEVRIGYGFNYANSHVDHFIPKYTLEEILDTYSDGAKIEGVYDPYFTPHDQQAHSLLLSVVLKPRSWAYLDFSGNLGVLANANIPYLYLDSDTAGNLLIRKGFSREGYFPVQASARFSFQLSGTVHLDLRYQFMTTYYFSRHTAGLGLKIYLFRGKR